MKKTLIFVAILAALAFTSCKRDVEPEAPNPSTPEAQTSEDAVEVPEKKFVDYGDDEIGQALNAYQKTGYWFKTKVPELIENTASRIDYYKPLQSENGNVYQFAKIAGAFKFDGEPTIPVFPYMLIYEGDTDLKEAYNLFQANWLDIEITKDIRDNMRTFFPRDGGRLPNGLNVKDSYIVNDMPQNIDLYEGKHVVVFGGNTDTNELTLEYVFDIQ